MSLTQKQIAKRGKFLNASELAPILGQSAFGQSQADAIMLKIQERRGEKVERPTNEWFELGHAVEPALVEWAERQRCLELRRNQSRVADDGIIACTLDALDRGGETSVEAKHNLVGPKSEEWGMDSDEIPTHYLIQVAAQFHVVKTLKLVLFPVWFRSGRKLYEVTREQAEPLIQEAIPEGIRIWNEHILPETLPAGAVPSLKILKQLIRTDAVAEVDAEIAEKWLELDELRLLHQRDADVFRKMADGYEAQLLHAMGRASVGVCAAGRIVVKRSARRGYEVKPGETVKITWEPTNGKELT